MYEELKGKKLLILGGITAMVEVAKRAHELGIIVYVTDYLENSPAKKVADKSFMVSATDVDAVVKLCKEETVDGIITGNCDMLLPYYAQICNKLNFPCYGTVEQFEIMTDKKRFKDLCRKYSVPTIPEYTEEDVELDKLQYPVLIKPIDSSGSRGITICYNKEDIVKGREKALSYSPSKKYLIEKYMQGDEVVLYYYFQDGQPTFVTMCDRYVHKQAIDIPQISVAYIFPSNYINEYLKTEIDANIVKMFKETGLKNGCIFLQAFIENGIPYIYEPGYRTNGAREQYIINQTCGISCVDMLISYALTGKEYEGKIQEKLDPYLNGKVAAMISPIMEIGKVDKIIGLEKLQSKQTIVETILINQEGSVLTEKDRGTLKQIAYRAYIVEANKQDLKKTVDYVLGAVEYEDSEKKSLIKAKFNSELI